MNKGGGEALIRGGAQSVGSNRGRLALASRALLPLSLSPAFAAAAGNPTTPDPARRKERGPDGRNQQSHQTSLIHRPNTPQPLSPRLARLLPGDPQTALLQPKNQKKPKKCRCASPPRRARPPRPAPRAAWSSRCVITRAALSLATPPFIGNRGPPPRASVFFFGGRQRGCPLLLPLWLSFCRRPPFLLLLSPPLFFCSRALPTTNPTQASLKTPEW